MTLYTMHDGMTRHVQESATLPMMQFPGYDLPITKTREKSLK